MRTIQRGIATGLVLVILLILGVAVTSGYLIFYQNQQKLASIDSFEDCAQYFPVMESYPAQCNTPDGRHFVQELSEEEKQKLVPPLQQCTLEALICPDGSSVRRTGPNCEFAECPSASGDISNWKTYRSETLGYEIKYPQNWNIYMVKDYPYEGYPGVFDPNSTAIILTPFPRFPKFSAGDGSGDNYLGFNIGSLDDVERRIEQIRNLIDSGKEEYSVKEINISGTAGYKVDYGKGDIAWYIKYPNKKTGIEIRYKAGLSGTSLTSESESIVQTFKFVD